MKDRNWGRIVFISSESGVQIPAEMIHYGMTKTAQLAISRGLAESVAGTGITVNSVLPGPTKSRGVGDFVEKLAKKEGKSFEEFEEEFFQKMRPTSLIKRFAAPEGFTGCLYSQSTCVRNNRCRTEGRWRYSKKCFLALRKKRHLTCHCIQVSHR
jgi:NAD(P)-dependent dehydrogenase (short-subunit alcohol dehydrogenase family)